MLHRYLVASVLLIAVFSCTVAFAAGAGEITGTWLNQDKDAKIEIFQCGSDFCGKIVWLKDPVYPPGSKEGTPGTPKIDTKNPDSSRRKDPLMGLQIVNGLHPSGNGQWNNGKIYDPDSGKTYSAKATLVSPDELDLRGFIGVSLLGRTEKWTRTH